MYYIVYRTTNTTNGKSYVGKHKTSDLEDGYLGSGKLLKHAIAKYGKQAFVREVFALCESESQMSDLERKLVDIGPESYNLCPGGTGGFGYINVNKLNNKNHEHVGALKSARQTGTKKPYKPNLKRKGKKVFDWTGRHHSEQTKLLKRQIMSGRFTGKNNSQYGTMWITTGLTNKKIRVDQQLPAGYFRGRI